MSPLTHLSNTATEALWGNSNVVGLGREPLRVLISENTGVWLQSLMPTLNELVALRSGWDGYQAKPVKFDVAHFTAEVVQRLETANVPAPSLVPGINGDLQLEWHARNWDIELHVRAPYEVHAWRSGPNVDPDGEDIELTADYSIVRNWVREIAALNDNAAAAA